MSRPLPPRSTADVDLATLTPAERELWLSGFSSGVAAGIDMGRRQRMDEEEAAWQRMRDRIRWVASQPLYSELCVRRSEHDRAEVARAHERRLGVAS